MAAPDTASEFRTTNWAMIVGARACPEGLDLLLREYWNPIYAFVRRCGFARSDADDIAQQFVHDVVIDRDLIARADPARGRFRSFVRTALRRFVVDVVRRNGRFQPTDPDAFESLAGADDGNAARDFDQQWATRVLEIAMQRLEEDCRRSSMTAQWKVFQSRLMHPAINGTSPVAIEDLQRELGIPDAQQIYSMLQTMKRKAESTLRQVVEETVENSDQGELEYLDLRTLLG